MITINNDTYRNLQEQVLENKEQIAKHWNVDRVLADFGIKVVGQLTYSTQLPGSNATYPSPAAPDYTGNYGDAYAVGTSEPYNFWIYTRADANAGYTTPYWLDIGRLAVIGPQGPAGQDGAKGDTGERGSLWFFGTSLPSGSTYKQYDKFMNTSTGVLYNYSGAGWTQIGTLRGPQGIQGIQGKVGPTGPQGPRGAQGAQGNPGQSFHVEGIVETIEQLPTPTQAIRAGAYEVGNEIDGYAMYIIVGGHNEGDTLEWFNAGKIEGIEGPQGPQGPQGVQGEAGVGISEFTVAEVTSDTENTYTKINAEMTDGSELQFTVTAQRGRTGRTGAKIDEFSTTHTTGTDGYNNLQRFTTSTVTALMSDGSTTNLTIAAANGLSGTNWWFGSYVPDNDTVFEPIRFTGRPNTVLQVGDFYLRNTGEVYRCDDLLTGTQEGAATGHWVNTYMTMKGPQGEPGTNPFTVIEYTVSSATFANPVKINSNAILIPNNDTGSNYWSFYVQIADSTPIQISGNNGICICLYNPQFPSQSNFIYSGISGYQLKYGNGVNKYLKDLVFTGSNYVTDSNASGVLEISGVDIDSNGMKYGRSLIIPGNRVPTGTLPADFDTTTDRFNIINFGRGMTQLGVSTTDLYLRTAPLTSSDFSGAEWVKITGGAGGSGLPEVTTDNNGQFLRVVDGVWAAATVPNAEEASF